LEFRNGTGVHWNDGDQLPWGYAWGRKEEKPEKVELIDVGQFYSGNTIVPWNT
jgi:hypothetical protein